MVKDTITVVKNAENEAANLARKTEEKQQELLNRAKQEVLAMKQQQNQQISDYSAKVEQETNQKNEEVMKQKEEEAKAKISQLIHHAEEKKMEAIQLILDTIG